MSHTATRLPNGKVLIAGGYSGQGPNNLTYLASAELYDPATGTFSPTGSMSSARYHCTATPLTSGIVVIAGGTGLSGSLASVALYDPGTGGFRSGGSMTAARVGHTATLLSNGRVLLAGGARADQPASPEYLASAELYDPAGDAFAATGSMAAARSGPLAVRLYDGRVLVVGGLGLDGSGAVSYPASAELYDSATGAFTTAGPTTGRVGATATLLADGRVLIAGGGATGGVLASADLYQP
jgi:hypothetical protein